MKRDLDSLVYSDTEETPPEEPNKRQRKQATSKSKRQPAVDPTYGQKWAFQVTDGLGVPSDDDLEFEDQTEALEYLRSVQQETKKIPHVVVAPKAGPQLPPEYLTSYNDSVDRSIYHNGVGDSRGYYHDGAYTAMPDDYLSSTVSSDEEHETSFHATTAADHDPIASSRLVLTEAYFSSLVSRFTSLRARLHLTPPAHILSALPPQHETCVPSFAPGKSTFRTWTHRIRYTDPLPAQLAAMDKTSVLRLLRVVLGGKFFRRGCELRPRTSRWLWALLARLPDKGQMDSDEVGIVRDLGKRAVAVSISREHVVALCEVLGREEVVAFGLSGVLHEIEGKKEEQNVDVGEGEEDGEDDDEGALRVEEHVEVHNEDEIRLSPEPDGRTESQDAAEGLPNDSLQSPNADAELEDGELPKDAGTAPLPQPFAAQVNNPDDEDMEVDMDLDLDEGEVPDEPPSNRMRDAPPHNSEESPSDAAKEAAIAAMKARLLSDLEHAETWEERPPSPLPASKKPDTVTELENMRATVNMILTVAGEFYGQRDLLAFRDPFGGVPYQTDGDDE